MKMILLGLIFGQLVLYLIQRFWLKGKKTIYRRIVQAFSWAGLGVWLLLRWIPYEFLAFHLLWLFLTLPVAYLLYVLSLWIVGTRMNRENLIPLVPASLKGKLWDSYVRESSLNLLSSAYEELLYRWFLQNAIYELTGSTAISIVITSALFFLVHVDSRIAIVQMADILLFSVAITLYYQWSINPIYCIIIHIVRNQLIISQKYIQAYNEQQKIAKYMRLLQNKKNRTGPV